VRQGIPLIALIFISDNWKCGGIPMKFSREILKEDLLDILMVLLIIPFPQEELKPGAPVMVGGLEIIITQHIRSPANQRGGMLKIREMLLQKWSHDLFIKALV
jgi:hypothetical protein